MPDLGNYAAEVALAYAGSLALLAALVGISWAGARASKRRLDETEGRGRG